MTKRKTTDFNFEDWAGLYQENPQEFEARRQTALLIELARGTPEQSAAGKALLKSYEKRVKNTDPLSRIKIATDMMCESLQQLNTELKILQQATAISSSKPQSD